MNLTDPTFLMSLRNSFINGFLTMGIALLLGVPAAYGMGRFKVRGSHVFLLTFLVGADASGFPDSDAYVPDLQ